MEHKNKTVGFTKLYTSFVKIILIKPNDAPIICKSLKTCYIYVKIRYKSLQITLIFAKYIPYILFYVCKHTL